MFKQILLIVNYYLKIWDTVSYLINLYQVTEFTHSFSEASWQANVEIAGSWRSEKTNR